MRAIVLGSGSKGNSTLILNNGKKILIDVGFSYPKMKMLLSNYDISPSEIDAILITHTHTDHIGGLKSFVSKNNVRVYINNMMYPEIVKLVPNELLMVFDDDYNLYDLNVSIIRTSHDSIGSVGFVLSNNCSSIVYITDTGYINKKYINLLTNHNIYIFESNHDVNMLMDGPYPYILKQRVVSDKGHLSNEMAGNYLKDFIGCNTKKIVLAHLSEINNTEELALKTVKDIIGEMDIVAAKQDESIDIGEF